MTTFEELRWQTVATLESLSADAGLPPRRASEEHDSEVSESDGCATNVMGSFRAGSATMKFLESYNKAQCAQSNESDWQGIEIYELERCQEETQKVLMRLEASRNALQTLKAKYEGVAERTSSLHEACDQLMSDQTQLASSAEEIRSRMAFFEHSEQIMQKLGSQHFSVTGESFTHLLATIDDCLKFLQENPHYKESSLYISKYRQCLSRALSAVKSHFTHVIHATTATIRQKMNDPANDDSFTLLYGVFATHAQTIRPLMQTLEDKYESILSDCYQTYLSERHALLLPSVNSTVQQLVTKYNRSSCTLVRTGCTFLLRLCDDEYRLFFQFFTRPSEQLHGMTERLCRVLYDAIRPMVIHINHLETLAELCTVIKVEMLEDRCSEVENQSQ